MVRPSELELNVGTPSLSLPLVTAPVEDSGREVDRTEAITLDPGEASMPSDPPALASSPESEVSSSLTGT